MPCLRVANVWSVPFTLAQLDRKDIRTVKEIKSMFSETIPSLADKLSILESGLFGNLEIECKGIEKGRDISNTRMEHA